MNKRFLSYGRQSIEVDDIEAVISVMSSDYLTQGPIVERFEAALAEKVNAKHAIAVANGTAGLHLACLAAGVRSGNYGLTSALTFVASANCIYYAGGETMLVDIELDNLGLSPELLRAKLNSIDNISAVIPVYFGGLAANCKEIRALADRRVVIADACHALGGDDSEGNPVGSGKYVDMTVFSFHPVKPITTAEGGAVVTNDDQLAYRLRMLRSHGIERDSSRFKNIEDNSQSPQWYYEQQLLGYNYRMTDLQAALGISQLKKLDRFTARRREIARYYDAELRSIKAINRLQAAEHQRKRSALHLYLIDIDWNSCGINRSIAIEAMRDRGIGTQVHYVPIYRHPYHAERMKAKVEDYDNTERYYSGCLTIPLFPSMTDEEAKNVVLALKEVIGAI